jgi:restriction endonuclease S subunit
MSKHTNYLPVDPDFYDIVDALIGKNGTVNFFESGSEINDVKGDIVGTVKKKSADFLKVSGEQYVRLDKVITILGKPGPAYDRYNHYSNVCFSCFDEGQF